MNTIAVLNIQPEKYLIIVQGKLKCKYSMRKAEENLQKGN